MVGDGGRSAGSAGAGLVIGGGGAQVRGPRVRESKNNNKRKKERKEKKGEKQQRTDCGCMFFLTSWNAQLTVEAGIVPTWAHATRNGPLWRDTDHVKKKKRGKKSALSFSLSLSHRHPAIDPGKPEMLDAPG